MGGNGQIPDSRPITKLKLIGPITACGDGCGQVPISPAGSTGRCKTTTHSIARLISPNHACEVGIAPDMSGYRNVAFALPLVSLTAK